MLSYILHLLLGGVLFRLVHSTALQQEDGGSHVRMHVDSSGLAAEVSDTKFARDTPVSQSMTRSEVAKQVRMKVDSGGRIIDTPVSKSTTRSEVAKHVRMEVDSGGRITEVAEPQSELQMDATSVTGTIRNISDSIRDASLLDAENDDRRLLSKRVSDYGCCSNVIIGDGEDKANCYDEDVYKKVALKDGSKLSDKCCYDHDVAIESCCQDDSGASAFDYDKMCCKTTDTSECYDKADKALAKCADKNSGCNKAKKWTKIVTCKLVRAGITTVFKAISLNAKYGQCDD